MTGRREFLQRAAAGAVASISLPPTPLFASPPSSDWDLSWVTKVNGKHKALFDVAEIESGFGVWRAAAWAGQYMEVLGATPQDLSPVIVLRHNGIVLAMNQAFWDEYRIGPRKSVRHPLTNQLTTKNPVLLDETSGIPAPFNNAALHKQLARGVTVLACNLALQDCVDLVKTRRKVTEEAARKIAVDALVSGVILQPSGVFAAVRAQQAGCAYVRSS